MSPGATSGCVFCMRIARGDYENEMSGCVVFTPLHPVVIGHKLVVPKQHVESAVEDTLLTGLAFAVAAGIVKRRGDDHYLIVSVGAAATQVRHLHVHILPRVPGDGLTLPWTTQTPRPRPRPRRA